MLPPPRRCPRPAPPAHRPRRPHAAHRHSHRPAGPTRRPGPRTVAARRSAHRLLGGENSAGSPRATASNTGWSGTRVCTRIARRGRSSPRPHQAGGMHQQGQGLVGGAEAGGQQVQIDVEEHHRGRAPDPVQHGFGAHEHRCGRHVCQPGCARHLAHLDPEQRRDLLAQTASRRPAASSCASFRRRRRSTGARSGSAGNGGRTRTGPRRRHRWCTAPARRNWHRPGAGPDRSGRRSTPAARGRRSRRGRRARSGPDGRTPRRTCRCVGRPPAGPRSRSWTSPLSRRRPAGPPTNARRS